MAGKPKVSVVSISYNQDKYIKQTLEGFVKQKTDFAFEVIIADDCSTDDTQKIIEDYAKKYPEIIKPVLRKKNVGIANNLYDAMARAQGKYLALCEGDDYWTDYNKLQIQADFLDKHPDYAVCFHTVKIIFENEKKELIFPENKDTAKFKLENLLERNFIQTNSVMYRRQPYIDLPVKILPIDWYLHLYHARTGKIKFMDKVMSVYRRHPQGVWWDSYKEGRKLWRESGTKYLELYKELLTLFKSPEHQEIISKHIASGYNRAIEIDLDENTHLVEDYIEKFPALTEIFIYSQSKLLLEQRNRGDKLRKNLEEETEFRRKLKSENDNMQNELLHIKRSMVWKIRNKSIKLLKFFKPGK